MNFWKWFKNFGKRCLYGAVVGTLGLLLWLIFLIFYPFVRHIYNHTDFEKEENDE